ncbi:pyrroline-5-carboxylate reductase [Jeotgalibacillus haloalkalitolerans]|uniref:Pyrroline-5-carboxylate reductase n=1 Tax=Jeotgalibacillus haloalkalitolerans TaxID=3104292 RepID=A0ABU5KLR6_9BACL|nr:pyrroline-5-carboxylate reductase [Jeotgalibacillus sp. HH7-29]MDZ5712082.1 pyrroline-5-carboxylate reductase [Jeotgalibacillus sp. HH7-29]
MKMVFIGAGSMAEAMIKGIKNAEAFSQDELWVTNRNDKERLQLLTEKYDVKSSYDLSSLLTDAEVIILAVKPKDASDALQAIRPYVKGQLLISVLAGLSIGFIESIIGKAPIARAMPNTSAMIGQSATGLSFNDQILRSQHTLATSIFSAIGSVTHVEESRLDLVTGLSGSGPAYIYYIVEAMEKAASELGEDAMPFIIQTLKGAAHMLESSDQSPEELRKAITSEGGTTEAGIAQLESHHVKDAFAECIKEATDHSGRLRRQFEQAHNI